jgi:hypothetical protein
MLSAAVRTGGIAQRIALAVSDAARADMGLCPIDTLNEASALALSLLLGAFLVILTRHAY